MAQQSKRARAYDAHPSIRDHWALRATRLTICTQEERRAVIRYLFVECMKPAQIIRRTQVQYDGSCLLRGKIHERTERFKQGRTSAYDYEKSGSPSMSTTETNVQVVESILMEGMSSIYRRYQWCPQKGGRIRTPPHSP
ncbi:hypothetical protein TNCV_3834221 [Trichonephila clavipes]|nr:hypothetical protein TNCV_3834221 [Trichonephila clavipes]